jgi:chromosomal replication initiation ATPase DnaA
MARPLRLEFKEAIICDLILREIGTIFGGMDYAAVAQGIRRIDRDKAMQRKLKTLLTKC